MEWDPAGCLVAEDDPHAAVSSFLSVPCSLHSTTQRDTRSYLWISSRSRKEDTVSVVTSTSLLSTVQRHSVVGLKETSPSMELLLPALWIILSNHVMISGKRYYSYYSLSSTSNLHWSVLGCLSLVWKWHRTVAPGSISSCHNEPENNGHVTCWCADQPAWGRWSSDCLISTKRQMSLTFSWSSLISSPQQATSSPSAVTESLSMGFHEQLSPSLSLRVFADGEPEDSSVCRQLQVIWRNSGLQWARFSYVGGRTCLFEARALLTVEKTVCCGWKNMSSSS